MTEPTEYTPTTSEVRALYVTGTPGHRVSVETGSAEFDRWLAAHDAEVVAAGVDAERERAAREASRPVTDAERDAQLIEKFTDHVASLAMLSDWQERAIRRVGEQTAAAIRNPEEGARQ